MSGRLHRLAALQGFLNTPKLDSAKSLFLSFFLGIWLVFLTLFFLLRFTFSFYYENAAAIKALFGAS
jgi:hypothetical protein